MVNVLKNTTPASLPSESGQPGKAKYVLAVEALAEATKAAAGRAAGRQPALPRANSVN
jgi:hypothetical protein